MRERHFDASWVFGVNVAELVFVLSVMGLSYTIHAIRIFDAAAMNSEIFRLYRYYSPLIVIVPILFIIGGGGAVLMSAAPDVDVGFRQYAAQVLLLVAMVGILMLYLYLNKNYTRELTIKNTDQWLLGDRQINFADLSYVSYQTRQMRHLVAPCKLIFSQVEYSFWRHLLSVLGVVGDHQIVIHLNQVRGADGALCDPYSIVNKVLVAVKQANFKVVYRTKNDPTRRWLATRI